MQFQVSEHIKLIPLYKSDAQDILHLVDSSRVNLDKFLYWVKDVNCLHSAQKYIEDRINSGLAGAQWFKVYFQGEICGIFAIKSICSNTFIAELGYWLADNARGHNIIYQIIQSLPELLKATKVKTIEFRCLAQNLASINIALKSGATLIKTIPDFIIVNSSYQHLNIYQKPLE